MLWLIGKSSCPRGLHDIGKSISIYAISFFFFYCDMNCDSPHDLIGLIWKSLIILENVVEHFTLVTKDGGKSELFLPNCNDKIA